MQGYTEAQQEYTEGAEPKLYYNTRWAFTYLKKFGALDNISRGLWEITEKGNSVNSASVNEITKTVKNNVSADIAKKVDDITSSGSEAEGDWTDELKEVLLQLHPSQFEGLCQRVLRQSGFVEVDVTGKVGDGGLMV